MDNALKSCRDILAVFDVYIGRSQGGPYIFRGQPRSDWTLRPSIMRMAPHSTVPAKMLNVEKRATEQFKRHYSIHGNELDRFLAGTPPDSLVWWSVMQHYGAPTRLLDWTESPYVALYYAVCDNWEHPGTVWALDIVKLYEMPGTQDWWPEPNDPEKMEAAMAANDHGNHLSRVEYSPVFARMAAQQSVFTVCPAILPDHDCVLDSVFKNKDTGSPEPFRRIEIPPEVKPEMLRHLMGMNITGASMFPDLDGVGRFVSDLTRLRVDFDNPLKQWIRKPVQELSATANERELLETYRQATDVAQEEAIANLLGQPRGDADAKGEMRERP